jgi:hypothetical protein
VKYLHFKIPESDARCNSCGNDPSDVDEWIIGTVETPVRSIFMATSPMDS